MFVVVVDNKLVVVDMVVDMVVVQIADNMAVVDMVVDLD